MEGIQEHTARGHVLRTPTDWQLFKTFVHAYARKRFAMGILTGTEDCPDESKKLERRDYELRSGDQYFYILSNLGPEYVSSIQGADSETCHAAWLILCGMFEGVKHISISMALRNFTTFQSVGLSAGKFLADLHLLSETLKSVIPRDMKIIEFIDMLEVQTMLNGLPEDFDALKTNLRAQGDLLTLRDIRDRIISEDTAIRQQYKPSSLSASALQVAERTRKHCTNHGCPNPRGHSSAECWFKFPELKTKFASQRKREYSNSSAKSSLNSSAKSASISDHSSPIAWTVKDTAHQVFTAIPNYDLRGITRSFNMDSGCTATIVNSSDGLIDIDPTDTLSFSLADRSIVKSEGAGYATGNGKFLKCSIVRTFQENLLSIPQLYDDQIATLYHPLYGIIIAKADDMQVQCNKTLGQGQYVNGTFMMDICLSNNRAVNISKGVIVNSKEAAIEATKLGIPIAIAPVVDLSTKSILWYKRLGYSNPQRIVDAIKNNLIAGVNLPKNITINDFNINNIEEYQLAKSKAQPHKNLHMKKHSNKPYHMVHIDFKYIGIKSWGGAIGVSTIVDDYSRKIHVLPLSSKKYFVPKFREFVNQHIISKGFNINIIRCDNGTEIKNYKFNEFLTVMCARAEFSSTYSPESDGVAERAHQTILSIANTMRVGSNLPPASWAELLHTACFVHSLLPSKSNPRNMTPF